MKEAKQNRDRLIVKRNNEARAQEQTSVTLMLVCNLEEKKNSFLFYVIIHMYRLLS
jgi:hypothetical protein